MEPKSITLKGKSYRLDDVQISSTEYPNEKILKRELVAITSETERAKKQLDTHKNAGTNTSSNLFYNGKNRKPVGTASEITHTTVLKKTAYKNLRTDLSSKVKRGIQNNLDSQGDSGSGTLAVGISATTTMVRTYRIAEKSSQPIINQSVKIGKSTAKVIIKTDEMLGRMATGSLKIDRDLVGKLVATGKIKVKNTKAVSTALKKLNAIKNGTLKVKVVSKKIVSGNVKKEDVKKIVDIGIKTSKKNIMKLGKASKRTGIKITKGVDKGILIATDNLSNTDDIGVQTVASSINVAHYTAVGVSKIPKVTKITYNKIQTGRKKMGNTKVQIGRKITKTYRGIEVGMVMAEKEGVKKTANYYAKKWRRSIRGRTSIAFKEAGRSVTNLGISIIKNITKKAVVPMAVIVLIVLLGSSVLTSTAAIIGSIFSPYISKEGMEINESEWLISKITISRNELIQNIKQIYINNLVANGGHYHYVRFYDAFSGNEVALMDTNISTSLYDVDEYLECIQPIFHTLVLSKYELDATESELDEVFNDIWYTVSEIVTEDLPTEYCDGLSGCPNYIVYSIGDIDGDGIDEIVYQCLGHNILKLSVSLKGFGDLLNDYFLHDINVLENKLFLTEEEKRKLNNLKSYYEICVIYLQILEEEYGVGVGSSEVVNLDGVTLTVLTDYACQFVGNPYVWGGNDPNTGADCSGFVRYVYAHFGVSLPRTSREQVNCGITIPTIQEAKAGDLLFFTKSGTNTVNHVAIYLGNGKIVHASNSKPYPRGGIKISNIYRPVYKIKRVAE